jgi:hypothetical protein
MCHAACFSEPYPDVPNMIMYFIMLEKIEKGR